MAKIKKKGIQARKRVIIGMYINTINHYVEWSGCRSTCVIIINAFSSRLKFFHFKCIKIQIEILNVDVSYRNDVIEV